jgi:HD-GYP domain-containing protein (c-di-GMP phosphodiesterase class II)
MLQIVDAYKALKTVRRYKAAFSIADASQTMEDRVAGNEK